MTLLSFFRSILRLPVWVVLVLLLLIFAYFSLQELLIIVFLSYILMAALLPIVNLFQMRGIPRPIAILVVYVLILTPIILFIYFVLPNVISQSISFINSFPSYLDQTIKTLHIRVSADQLRSAILPQLQGIFSQTYTFLSTVLGGFFSIITLFFTNFYLLLDHDKIHKKTLTLVDANDKKKLDSVIVAVENRLRVWAQGQVILSLFVGTLTGLLLFFLGIDYALPIGIFAGIMEFVPLIGPIIGFIPAFILAVAVSPAKLLVTAIAYVIIQSIEGNVLVPQIMNRALKLHPLVVLLGVIIGSKILGIFGALFAVPVITILHAIWQETHNDEA